MNYLIYGLSKSGKSCTRLLNTKDNVLYLFDDDIYNIKTPNHLGYPLGKVIKVNDRKIYIILINS